MKKQRLLPILAVILGASSFGFLSSIIKLSYENGFSEKDVTVSQITMGAVIMLLVYLASPRAWANPFRGPWIPLSLIGIFGLSLTTILYNKTLSELDASLAIILLFQFTWMTMVMEGVWTKRRPSRGQIGSLALILLGTMMAVDVLQIDWGRFTLKGLLLGIGSAVTYSLFLFCSGRVRTDWSPLLKSVIMLTAGLPAVYLFYSVPNWVQPNAGSLVLWGCILGILGQALPNVMFMIGIPRIGSSLAAILGAMELPVATISAFLILHERVNGVQWAGIVMILAGVVLAEVPLGRTRERAEAG